MKNFVHLHVHTDHSMLDGLGTVEAYVEKAKKLGMPALAVTDHGNIMSAPLFYTECRKAGINPIIGEEFYFVPDAEKSKDDKVSERFHVGILAKNEAGFRTLCDLSTAAYNQFYYKPVLDRALLEGLGDAAENLVVLSGCAAGILSRKLLGEAVDDVLSVRDELEWWKQIFPNFYVEIMHHGTSFDRKLNKKLLRIAGKHELPWVITNDPHYVDKNQHDHHDALLAIQTASDIDDPNRFSFEGNGYHLRSVKEMKKAFSEYGKEVWIPGAKNTLSIAKEIDIRIPEWDTRSWHIPKFPLTDDASKLLRKLTMKALEDRGLIDDEKYVKRAKHELKKLIEVGMADFLLITMDAIQYARRATKRHRKIAKKLGHPPEPIRVGPGRGSVCGTLVGYLIGIHKIDPIRYDLSFERFLNPERPKAPDVDTDYQKSRRHEIGEYYIYLYGSENVIPVGAYQTMQTKRCFQSLARAYGIHDSNERNRLSKEIEEDEEGNAVLPEVIRTDFPELVESLDVLTGVKASMSTHAAGLIVMDPKDNIRNYIPRMFIPKRQGSPAKWVCQYNLAAAEILMLFKQDNLGLRTLDTIEECVRLIEKRHKVSIDPDEWIPDEERNDKIVYKMLTEGHCEGVFQMEGKTNFRGIQEIKPKGFMDIAVCTSLYRKGPMEAGAEKRFLENKRDRTIRVAHESLQPYLGMTWGELIYQEQMFAILNEVAGFSWSRVDDAKSAMSKKDPEKMAALKDEAIAGFRKIGGMSKKEAEEVWNMIAAQAGYLFNKSHAVAYSLTTYQTARLKHFYELEFFTALLRTVEPKAKDAKAKRMTYLNAALRSGIKVLPPDINISDALFMCHGKSKLLFGFQDIKGIGQKQAEKIVRGRPKGGYKSIEQVTTAVNNKGVMQALADSGALKTFGVQTTEERQADCLDGWQFDDPMVEYRRKFEHKAKLPKGDNSQVRIYGQIVKAEKARTKNGNDYMKWVIRWAPGQEFRITLWSDAFDLFDLRPGSIVRVSGRWNNAFGNVAIGDSDMVRVLKAVRSQRAA